MKRQKSKQQNRAEIDLLTHEKNESPLFLDDEILSASASVLAIIMLDFIRANDSNTKLTPKSVFKKEQKQ